MARKPVVHGLVKKRAETVGQLNALQEEQARLIADLDHLDASIRLFEPDIDFDDMPVKYLPPPNAAFRGEFARYLLEQLRGQQRWLDTYDLTDRVMRQRRMNHRDQALRVTTRKRVGHSLSRLRKKGVVRSRKGGKRKTLLWKITAPDAQIEWGWRNGATAAR